MNRALPLPGAQAFADESKHRHYVVVAVLAATPDLPPIRKVLKGLRLPGQSRLHCRDESDRRRRQLISEMSRLPVTNLLYRSTAAKPREARAACLQALAEDLIELKAEQLVLELAEGDLMTDRKTLYQSIRAAPSSLRYDHAPARAEPMLWIPDTVAWAWCRSAEWRNRVRPMISRERQV